MRALASASRDEVDHPVDSRLDSAGREQRQHVGDEAWHGRRPLLLVRSLLETPNTVRRLACKASRSISAWTTPST